MKSRLTSFLDFFYPPFRAIMPFQTFRYAACGAINTLLGLILYSILYTHIFEATDVVIWHFIFKPHTAALLISFCFNFSLGFLLNKYIVFTSSNLRGRIQLFRYLLSFLSNLAINVLLLKLMVEQLHWDAIISQVITTCIVVAISYFSQKHFSFKAVPDEV